MAIVMDMCSGTIELGCPADYNAEVARVDCKANSSVFSEPNLALQQINMSAREQNPSPAFLATLDIDAFLGLMHQDLM
ncbi:hypothetical protein [Sulfurirhabdus autotrophica]|uniref:Uncharacterized protein n=1 Tax=Sulfurirhabdus autotrophica TaxID=1706046 RepID=A0A4R3YF65_9PROT|nr:hypothetical protein [Sulfurirhabdus autotrophica]TCV90766.1 hypothetical protein EDC63_101740 [Sulfurirhabdus autotrophica]